VTRVRFRVGVQGRVLWQRVKLTPVAVTIEKDRADQLTTILRDELQVWDGKDIGSGFRVFVTQENK